MRSPLIGIARLAHSAPILREKRAAEYFQLPSFQLLNRCSSSRMPFEWTINPYRGCEFGCKYCYARYTHEFMELREPEDFERKIFAKQWNPSTFLTQLRKIDPADRIAIGTATDPYQPAERTYALTRSILAVFAGLKGRELSITTKSDLVTRDLDLLTAISRANKLYVNITVTTLNPELARDVEPLAPHPALRINALRQLRAAGVTAGLLCCPVMPLINDSEENLDALAAAAVSAGAQYMAAGVVYLNPPAQNTFLPFLESRFPHLAARYRERFSQGAYLRGDYPKRMAQRFRAVRVRHGLPSRFPDYTPAEWQEEAQLSLPVVQAGTAGVR